MKSDKTLARVAGILFIVATVASSISFSITEPFNERSNILEAYATHENQIIAAALLMLVDALAVAFISFALFYILKNKSKVLALGYAGMRIVESVLFILYVVFMMTLLSVGKEYVSSGSLESEYSKSIGETLFYAMEWSFDIGLGIVFTLSALILNYTLFRFQLVPRWLSAWGFLGALITTGVILLKFYNIHVPEYFDFVIGIQEMVFAGWLIIKGFNLDSD